MLTRGLVSAPGTTYKYVSKYISGTHCSSSATMARHGGDHVDVTPARHDPVPARAATPTRLSRRAAIKLLVAGGGVVLLAACAPQSTPPAPAATAAPAKPAEAAKPTEAAKPA